MRLESKIKKGIIMQNDKKSLIIAICSIVLCVGGGNLYADIPTLGTIDLSGPSCQIEIVKAKCKNNQIIDPVPNYIRIIKALNVFGRVYVVTDNQRSFVSIYNDANSKQLLANFSNVYSNVFQTIECTYYSDYKTQSRSINLSKTKGIINVNSGVNKVILKIPDNATSFSKVYLYSSSQTATAASADIIKDLSAFNRDLFTNGYAIVGLVQSNGILWQNLDNTVSKLSQLRFSDNTGAITFSFASDSNAIKFNVGDTIIIEKNN